MGVYIKGMEMPKDNCEAIQQITITNNWIDGEMKMLAHDSVTNEFIGEVFEVPEPHGRLIDADILKEEYVWLWPSIEHFLPQEKAIRLSRIDDAPTVIEAEGE